MPCLDRLAAYNPTFGTIAMRIAGADARRATYAMLARGRTGEGSLAPHEFIDRSYGAVFRAALRDRDRTQRLLHTDSYFQRFERDLAPVIQLYAVGTPASGRTGVLAVFAVRADRLTSEPGPEGRTLYPVRLRLAAVDSVGGTLRTIDTLRTFVVRGALPKDAWLSGTLELPLAPGTYDVRLLVTQPGDERGGAGGRLGVQIPGTAAELTISDIVSGEEGRGLAWHGAGAPFPLNPLGVFRRDATVELLYELGGLRTGAEYRTTLEISKGEGSDDRVSLRFTEAADGAVARVRRSIGLAGLRGGRYVLRLEVEEVGTGRRAVRERWLDVE